ncbi:MAG: hypothetical protein HY721_22345 [Planctomycetes bacterium]|nr:hypothetical protein [Planctomycetota bacterium]
MSRALAFRAVSALLGGVWFVEFAPAADPLVVRVLTRGGELVQGKPGLASIRVRTDYGTLEVPIGDVLSVSFAPVGAPEEVEKVRRLLAELAAPDLDDADLEDLRKDLLAVAASAPDALAREAARAAGKPAEVAASVLRDLALRVPGRAPGLDEVVTRRFTVLGRVELEEIALETAYGGLRLARSAFGSLAVGDASLRAPVSEVLILKTWTDPSHEFLRTRDAIATRTRLRLVEYEGSTAADLKKALKRFRVIVVPELEQPGNMGEVVAEASQALVRWVKEGGVVISCGGGSNIQFLTASNILPCTGGGGGQASIVARHPIVRGVADPIPQANATQGLRSTGNPRMKPLAVSGPEDIIVGVARSGQGAIVWCGWDYYESQDSHDQVLANAVKWAAEGGFAGTGEADPGR